MLTESFTSGVVVNREVERVFGSHNGETSVRWIWCKIHVLLGL